ncbi:MAG TPA: cation:proton antiporter, partial [Desulfurococcaceae archaeon]|nr:cation:proton antiporter [Desulfurococcaceae archaeon]
MMQFLNIEYGISPILLAVAAFALPLLSLVIKNKRFFDAYALVFGIVALYTSIKILHDVLAIHKPIVYPFGGWPPPVGIIYEVDTFGAVLGLLVSSVMLLIILYSWWYTKDVDGYVWYYT